MTYYLYHKKTKELRTERMIDLGAKHKSKTWKLVNGKRVWMEKTSD